MFFLVVFVDASFLSCLLHAQQILGRTMVNAPLKSRVKFNGCHIYFD